MPRGPLIFLIILLAGSWPCSWAAGSGAPRWQLSRWATSRQPAAAQSRNACQGTVDQMAANAAVNIRALLAQFPNVIIGDIEPFPVSASNWLPQYQAGIEAFRKALGFPLALFYADVAWDTPSYLADLASVRQMLSSEGIPFGIIYNGNGYATSDSQWIQSATQHMIAAELNLGSPDLVIFQSWDAYPKKLLPETDPDSFTSLIDTYFRHRTKLSSSISGSTLQGALTAADNGQPMGCGRFSRRRYDLISAAIPDRIFSPLGHA